MCKNMYQQHTKMMNFISTFRILWVSLGKVWLTALIDLKKRNELKKKNNFFKGQIWSWALAHVGLTYIY